MPASVIARREVAPRPQVCALRVFDIRAFVHWPRRLAQSHRMYRFSTSRARQQAVFVIRNRLLTRAARYMRLPWPLRHKTS